MLKKIAIFIILIISQFLIGSNIFASQISVEKVFLDIDKNYKYYDELQTLYDKGMIFPDENGKFNPNKLLNRDEFVGISMEVSCKKCISPNTDFDLTKKHYNSETFYDVNKQNKYFYCIAESDDLGYVKGYGEGYQCEGKTSLEGERPFCIDNRIRLDEALAVILRNAGIFTIEDNKNILEKIKEGEITQNLSEDVFAKNNDGQIYTFYGYIQKALNFELKEIDKDGNEKIYKLLEKKDNKIFPEKSISKEEFLLIAYIALKSNSCIDEVENDLALQINILNKSCVEGTECDNKKNDENENIFDFDAKIGGVCDKGINENNYKWTFYNYSTGKEITKSGKYLDNYKFFNYGKWRVNLNVNDNCGNVGEISSVLYIKQNTEDEEGNNIGVEIDATPLNGEKGLDVEFDGKVEGGDGDYIYEWDYGDGAKGEGKTPNNIYSEPGTYVVELKVIDGDGKVGTSTVTIVVTEKYIEDEGDSLGVEIDATPLYGEKGLDVEFDGKVKGGDGDYIYEWDYGDGTTGTGKSPYHVYKEPGTYAVELKVTDGDGKVGTSTVTIVVTDESLQDEEGFTVQIDASPLIGNIGSEVDFKGIVFGNNGPYNYSWDYGDGIKGTGEEINHIYSVPGNYVVTLIVTDKDGNIGTSEVIVKVLDFDSCEIDADRDGIMDCDDKLPQVPGVKENEGAPILENKCGDGCSCQEGYVCNIDNVNVCSTEGVCKPENKTLNFCLEEGQEALIYGNSVCLSCPCSYSLDFNEPIRKCDMIFPAITSPDSKKIYSRGQIYTVK